MPCTSAVRALRVDVEHLVERAHVQAAAGVRRRANRNRLDVRLASRTGDPGGNLGIRGAQRATADA